METCTMETRKLSVPQFITKNQKMALFDGFHLIFFFQNPRFFFEKKKLFTLSKNISKVHSYCNISRATFILYRPFLFQKFWKCALTFVFFFIKKWFCLPKSTCWIFLVRQTPGVKLLISVCCKRSRIQMIYSLQVWVEVWQIFIPKNLELLKTQHCVL